MTKISADLHRGIQVMLGEQGGGRATELIKFLESIPDERLIDIEKFIDFEKSVIDFVTAPTSDAIGARFLVKGPATGAFAGKEDKIAERVLSGAAGIWEFTDPEEGMHIANQADNGAVYYFNGTNWSTTEVMRHRNEIPTGEVLVIKDGERIITFGTFTVNGTLDVQGTGEFINIDGANRTIAVFDPSGDILTDTVVKVESDGRLNIPVFSAAPATVNDGDLFATDIAGVTLINFKVAGVIKSVQVT